MTFRLCSASFGAGVRLLRKHCCHMPLRSVVHVLVHIEVDSTPKAKQKTWPVVSLPVTKPFIAFVTTPKKPNQICHCAPIMDMVTTVKSQARHDSYLAH